MTSILEMFMIAVLVGLPWALGCMYIGYKLPAVVQAILWKKSIWEWITFKKTK